MSLARKPFDTFDFGEQMADLARCYLHVHQAQSAELLVQIIYTLYYHQWIASPTDFTIDVHYPTTFLASW